MNKLINAIIIGFFWFAPVVYFIDLERNVIAAVWFAFGWIIPLIVIGIASE